MSIAIRIDEELYEEAKKTAAAEFRTVPLQVAFWAKIGKVALENPDLPIEFIRDILIAKTQKKSEPFEFIEP
ncbi:MAG: hypothetical protein PHQ46_01040 [Negativicutes bacterium]|nr:hypothetical protein [Negativicutes bacterium]